MNNTLIYIGLVIVFQAILLASYKFIHIPEKAKLNRNLLFSIVLISIVFPILLMQIQWNLFDDFQLKFTPATEPEIQLEEVQLFLNAEVNTTTINSVWNQFTITKLVYLLGLSIFLLLFIQKLRNVFSIKRQSAQKHFDEKWYYEIKDSHEAFNFFNWIFMGSELAEKEKELIYIHENEHRRLKHSYDLLVLEILKVFFWFNPLFIWIQNELKAVHEIQADKKIETESTQAYAKLLLEKSMHCQPIALVNTFNKPLLKTRIMLLKNTQQERNGITYLILIPLLLLVISGSAFALHINNFVDEKNDQSYLDQLYNWEKTGAEDQLTEFAQKVNEFKIYQLSKDEFEMKKAWLKFQAKQTDSQNLKIKLNKLSYTDYTLLMNSNDTIAFAEVEEVPVFPNCEDLSSQVELKACMQQKITSHIHSEFNIKNVSAFADEGVNRIFVRFNINTKGEIDAVEATAEYEELKHEGERIVKKLPTMQPGRVDGKPVNVFYVLPIVFENPAKAEEKEEK